MKINFFIFIFSQIYFITFLILIKVDLYSIKIPI